MSKTSDSNAILNGASWYLAEKTLRLTGTFFISAWIAKYLGPESYGALAYAIALIGLLSFFGSWGIESLVVRDMVHACQTEKSIISTYFFIKLGGALLVAPLSYWYLATTHTNDSLLIVLAIICSTAVIFKAYDVTDCWLQARHQAKTTSLIRLVGFIVDSIAKGMLILVDADVEWFAGTMVIESAVIAVQYYFLLRQYNLLPSPIDWNFIEFKRMIDDGKTMAFSALTVAVTSKIDVLVIGLLFSKEVLGPYAIAASMCAGWNLVGMSLVQAWAPRISSAIAKSYDAYIYELRNMLFSTALVGLLGCCILFFLSGYIFDLLLGESYISGVAIFNILVWSSLFVFIGVATSQIIVNERIYWISFFRTAVGVLLSIAFIFSAAKNFGEIGVAGLVVISSCAATFSILFSPTARSTLCKIVLTKKK